MPRLSTLGSIALLLALGLINVAAAQHEHTGGASRVEPPTVFLDKSPRVVEYQLKRLSNEQLLLIETAADDKRYIPVFAAILSREGMPAANRTAALEGLVTINQSNPIVELVKAIGNIKGDDEVATRTRQTLANLILKSSRTLLSEQRTALMELVDSDQPLLQSTGLAALIASGNSNQAFALAQAKQIRAALFQGVASIPDPAIRGSLHAETLAATTSDHPESVRQAAIAALGAIPSQPAETFGRVAEYVQLDALRDAAVKTLLTVPADYRDSQRSTDLVAWLVDFAEATPAAERTTDSFLDAMELVDQLMSKVPADQAARFRNRLRDTVVRVVRIRTVEEEMRYDLPYFAVEAGRPVQVLLVNRDMMPHNLVITEPGALKEVAELGLQAGPAGGLQGKQYVPNSEKVLFATQMVGAHEQQALTFTAPETPGEYPYVCTFPRHWMRMYGVMVVVENLDAWLKQPVPPTDPVGSNRSFVKNWTADELRPNLATGLRGRSPELGKRLFVEASCAQCHKAGDLAAGNVGPELGQVIQRWKGDASEVLREILDPSHRIDPKYIVNIVVTDAGDTLTGLIVKEDADSIWILDNPEAPEPRVLAREEIVGMRKTSNSMMPKGLLDRFSQDEIFEILAFIQSVQQQ